MRQSLFGALGRWYPKADWAPQPLRAKATFQNLARDGDEAYARSVGILAPEVRAALLTDGFRRDVRGHRDEDRYVRAMRDAPARDPLDRAQYADLMIWLPGDILTKVDRTSMNVSLEAREPLLDYRLIEFAARLPVSMRIRGGEGKWLLKKAMEGHLPLDILYRPKMGFVTPVSKWFRGPLAHEAQDLVTKSLLVETGWFDAAALQGAVAAHRSGLSDNGRLIWQLFMLEKSLARLFG
jgi:asparagine synthase (glutamine-hydrolysing)